MDERQWNAFVRMSNHNAEAQNWRFVVGAFVQIVQTVLIVILLLR